MKTDTYFLMVGGDDVPKLGAFKAIGYRCDSIGTIEAKREFSQLLAPFPLPHLAAPAAAGYECGGVG